MTPTPSARSVTRASYRDIALYAPDRAPCRVDLSDNTNAWGVPPSSLRAIAEVGGSSFARYPQLYADSLKQAIATYIGTTPDTIVTGCGSDDILDSAIRAFAEPGDRMVFPDPTFPMVPLFARMNAAEPVAVPLTRDYDADATAMLAANGRIIYLCSPNNPTGAAFRRETIQTVVERARGDQIVLVDEAYIEYGAESVVTLTRDHPRLLVARTMSKAFGLAGLRVGYAIGAPELVAEVEKSRGPYKVSVAAQAAAIAVLGEGMGWVRERVALTIDNRRRFAEELTRRGLRPIDSAANFVMVPVTRANDIARVMRQRGVAVRPFENLSMVSEALAETGGSALRITIGPWDMMAEMLAAFDEAGRACG